MTYTWDREKSESMFHNRMEVSQSRAEIENYHKRLDLLSSAFKASFIFITELVKQ